MRSPERYVIPVDREMIRNVEDICAALRQTKELSYETFEDVQEAVLIALFEYLTNVDWTGIEVLLLLGKVDLDEVSFHLLRNLFYRLSDVSPNIYPRLHEGSQSLKDIVKYYRDPVFITHARLDARSNTMLVELQFDPD